ncbi:MAG: hypothetical protein COA58_04000 [Bacteroidetes bacterium]|nr:MAG: hypothetical protein COA58_04000 [Bacteroidota bacterium]
MRKPIVLIIFTFIVSLGFRQSTEPNTRESINPIIGDISFIEKFGVSPDQMTDENLRIKTHLEYVELRLRKRDIGSLTADLQEKRSKLLDLLHDYWTRGNFPENYDFEDERKPCFIDKNGTLCAVGYLVDQTSGREFAEKVNSLFKYSEIYDMELPALADWVANSGLTLQECAMIQPTYLMPKPNNYVEPKYGISSAILSGTNIAFMTLNGIQISKASQSKAVPVLGLIAGTGQLAIGVIKFPKEEYTVFGAVTNENQKAVSLINIGLGTSSIILSTYNLVSNRKPKKDKTVAWNLYSYPTLTNQVGLGLTFKKQF